MDLVTRVKNILITPKTEWYEIDAEETSIAQIYMGYVIPLMGLSAIAGLIGAILNLVIGGTFTTLSFLIVLVTLLLSFVVGLGILYLLALIVDKLAPTFEASPHMPSAFKLVAYGSTAGWVVGLLGILPIPYIGILIVLLSLYNLYLVYTGLPVVMRAPPEKALVYTIAIVVVYIVLVVLIGLIVGLIAAPIVAILT